MLGSRRAREGLLLALMAAAAACGTNPRYCDETTACGDPSQVCDLNGVCAASEGLTNSCIDPADICWDAAGPPPADAAVADAPDNTPDAPEGTPDAPTPDGFVPFDGFSCTADAFLRCDGSNIVTCSSDGMSEVTNACTYGCNTGAERCNECTPSTVVCSGSTRTTCSANGLITEEFACPLDCHPTGDRCYDLDPSNNLALYLDQTPTAPVVTLTDGATINTSTGAVTNGDSSSVTIPSALLAAPPGGVQLRVLMVKSITLNNVTISGSPALAIVADGRIEVRGRLDVGASGFFSCTGSAGSMSGSQASGGGGGGFGSAGGRGGNVGTLTGGNGGMANGTASLTPLRGGCGGGGMSGADILVSGAAGGAIQLSSRTEVAIILGSQSGYVDATGSGGHYAQDQDSGNLATAGAGGGSGGAILLEAPVVSVDNGAGLTANGGGGGCPADPGISGALSLLPAGGGNCASPDGDGGSGGALSGLTGGNGQDVIAASNASGGGGGGGVGRIRVNTADGTFTPAGSAIISPSPSVGTTGRR